MKIKIWQVAVLGGCFLAVGMVDSPDYHKDMSVKPKADAPSLSLRESKLVEYFSAAGSDQPVAMAKAVAQRKRPRLLAAVSKVESNGRVGAVGKSKEIGAWQQRPDLWGHPGHTAEEQAIAAEILLESLLAEENGRIVSAVRRYNGAGPKAEIYARKVVEEIKRVPKI